jgi:hypothetical protein
MIGVSGESGEVEGLITDLYTFGSPSLLQPNKEPGQFSKLLITSGH